MRDRILPLRGCYARFDFWLYDTGIEISSSRTTGILEGFTIPEFQKYKPSTSLLLALYQTMTFARLK